MEPDHSLFYLLNETQRKGGRDYRRDHEAMELMKDKTSGIQVEREVIWLDQG